MVIVLSFDFISKNPSNLSNPWLQFCGNLRLKKEVSKTKNLINVAIGVGVVSLILGIISRLMRVPFFGGMQLEAQAFLAFTSVCLLFAITFALLQVLKSKKE